MTHIGNILQNHLFEESSSPSERHEIISKITKKINESRSKDGFKPLQCAFINKKLRAFTTHDLYVLQRKCENSKKPDATFWVAVKS